MKIHEVVKNTPDGLEVPWEVWTVFGEKAKTVLFGGKEISLGEDFKSLEQLRTAISWYVDQLGGKVKWGE